MEIEYNIKNCPFTPFASCELFNSLDDGLSNQKIRWTIGTNFALNKKNSIEVYYRYQKKSDDDESIKNPIVF